MKKVILLALCTVSTLNAISQEFVDEVVAKNLEQEEGIATRTISPNVEKALIAVNEINNYVSTYIEQQLASVGKQLTSLPQQIQQEIAASSAKIVTALQQAAQKRKTTTLDKATVNAIVNQALAKYLQKTPGYITQAQLHTTIDQYIVHQFEQAGISVNDIAPIMQDEFVKRKKALEEKLVLIMTTAQRTYVTMDEITCTYQTIFDQFIARVRHCIRWEWFESRVKTLKEVPRSTSYVPESDESKRISKRLPSFKH